MSNEVTRKNIERPAGFGVVDHESSAYEMMTKATPGDIPLHEATGNSLI
jgi:hypothetical protein